MPSTAASSPARADSMITGIARVRSSARSAASRPKPSSRGIITSVRTRSGGGANTAVERGLAVGHGVHVEVLGEHARDVPAHVLVVVGEQHARARAFPPGGSARPSSVVASHCWASWTSASAPRVNAVGSASPSCSGGRCAWPRADA